MKFSIWSSVHPHNHPWIKLSMWVWDSQSYSFRSLYSSAHHICVLYGFIHHHREKSFDRYWWIADLHHKCYICGDTGVDYYKRSYRDTFKRGIVFKWDYLKWGSFKESSSSEVPSSEVFVFKREFVIKVGFVFKWDIEFFDSHHLWISTKWGYLIEFLLQNLDNYCYWCVYYCLWWYHRYIRIQCWIIHFFNILSRRWDGCL